MADKEFVTTSVFTFIIYLLTFLHQPTTDTQIGSMQCLPVPKKKVMAELSVWEERLSLALTALTLKRRENRKISSFAEQ